MLVAALVVVVLIAAVLFYASTKPNVFRVERSAMVTAPAEAIYPLLDDLAAWGSWSPWEKKDPGMKKTLSGAARGVGAVFEWDGDKKVGKGRMEIIEASAPGKVAIKLDFIKPFEGHNIAEFTLEPRGESTLVTWAMAGPNPFMGKLVSVFIDCEKMCGRDFEAGLANLKAVVEK
jgi:hypothetical protein